GPKRRVCKSPYKTCPGADWRSDPPKDDPSVPAGKSALSAPPTRRAGSHFAPLQMRGERGSRRKSRERVGHIPLRLPVKLEVVYELISLCVWFVLTGHRIVASHDQPIGDFHPHESVMVRGIAFQRYWITLFVLKGDRWNHVLAVNLHHVVQIEVAA